MNKYKQIMKQYPLIINSVQSGVLMGAGDAISQLYIEKTSIKNYSVIRTARFAFLGAFIVAPCLHKWYIFLDGLQPSKYKHVKKVLLDQFCFAPCFIVIFLSTLGVIQKHDVNLIKKDIKTNYVDILITNYTIWPFAQAINFSLVPLRYQVLFVQTVALFWNTYLSWKTQKKD